MTFNIKLFELFWLIEPGYLVKNPHPAILLAPYKSFFAYFFTKNDL